MKITTLTQDPTAPLQMEGTRGVKMRVLLGEADGAPGFTMRLFELDPEGHSPQHAHPHEHQVIVQAGSGTLWTAQGEHALQTGSVVLVEPNEEHQFRAGAGGLTFFCIVPHSGHG